MSRQRDGADPAACRFRAVAAALAMWALCGWASAQQAWVPPHYELRTASADGIGKFYLGREIARVVGHGAIPWLERPERVTEELPDQVVRHLELEPADAVADIGAGTGYFTFRLAARVPGGRVYAVDIQQEMLDRIRLRAARESVRNVVPHRGNVHDARLPAGEIDVVLLVDAYHEFSHPREMMESLVRALRPGGRAIFIEYRGEDPAVPIKPLHKMTQAQLRREMAAVGLRWKETRHFLPLQHFVIFQKE